MDRDGRIWWGEKRQQRSCSQDLSERGQAGRRSADFLELRRSWSYPGCEEGNRESVRRRRVRNPEAGATCGAGAPRRHRARRSRARFLSRVRDHGGGRAQDGAALDRDRDGRTCGHPLRAAAEEGDRRRAGRYLEGRRVAGAAAASASTASGRPPSTRTAASVPISAPRTRRASVVLRDRPALDRPGGALSLPRRSRRQRLRLALQRYSPRPIHRRRKRTDPAGARPDPGGGGRLRRSAHHLRGCVPHSGPPPFRRNG